MEGVPKRLVVCTDGTWNIPDQRDRGKTRPSNVVKMALAVTPRDGRGTVQRVFYDKGVGTGPFDRLRGGAFGWGLSQKIKEAYAFIVEQFEPDDEIFLFGFSRGAYTARSTAGLIRNSGILRPEYRQRLDDAFALYRRRDPSSHPTDVEATIFRKMYSYEPPITFIGVWDTVGALGIPVGIPWLPATWLHFLNKPWEFHDVKLSSIVKNAYHAVAIDEKRPQFAPTLWEKQAHSHDQRMEQVWFSGVHTNVGGGYADSRLSDITFLWMKEKAQQCGLAFDENYVHTTLHPNYRGELRNSKIGFYTLFRDRVRRIGHQHNGNEWAHDTAVKRLEHVPGYHPRNLETYLRRGGRVTTQ